MTSLRGKNSPPSSNEFEKVLNFEDPYEIIGYFLDLLEKSSQFQFLDVLLKN